MDTTTETNLQTLRDETGSQNEHILRWFDEADFKPIRTEGRSKIYDKARALEIIKAHKYEKGDENDQSAYKEKTRQEVIRLTRLNRIEEKLEKSQYMETKTVENMMLMGINKLELIPVKMESEFGLPTNVVARLRQLLDEARVEWSKGLMLTNEN